MQYNTSNLPESTVEHTRALYRYVTWRCEDPTFTSHNPNPNRSLLDTKSCVLIRISTGTRVTPNAFGARAIYVFNVFGRLTAHRAKCEANSCLRAL